MLRWWSSNGNGAGVERDVAGFEWRMGLLCIDDAKTEQRRVRIGG